MLETSYFTEALLLMAWGFVPWFTYYTFKESGHSLRKSVTALLLVFAWAFAALGIVKYGFDAIILGDSPLRPVVYLSLGVGLAWAFRWRIVGKGLSQHILIGLQLARPIGMVFVVEQFRGLLPGSFAGPAGWGDLTVGLIALYVVIRYRNRPIPDAAVITVIVAGILDFASAFFFGITSAAGPLQLFAFDLPNQVTLYPTGLIPLFLVPFAFIFHILSLTELQRSRKAVSEPAEAVVGHAPPVGA